MEDVHISGKGDLKGGEYASVTISGMGKCQGLLRAKKVTVSGTFKCEGGMEGAELTVNGTLKCVGPLASESVACNGAATVCGDLVANSLTIGGMFRVEGGSLRSASVRCTGTLRCDGAVQAGVFHATGLVRAQSLAADQVTIRSDHTGLLRRFANISSNVDAIDGDEITLTGVVAQRVTGRNVTIGPNCSIGVVEYSGAVQVSPESTVGTTTRLEPPAAEEAPKPDAE